MLIIRFFTFMSHETPQQEDFMDEFTRRQAKREHNRKMIDKEMSRWGDGVRANAIKKEFPPLYNFVEQAVNYGISTRKIMERARKAGVYSGLLDIILATSRHLHRQRKQAQSKI